METEARENLTTIGKGVDVKFSQFQDEVSQNSYRSRYLNEWERYKLWATHLGLYHSGHSSLDYRFRDSPPLFEYAARLLRDLNDEVSTFITALRDETQSNEAGDDDGEVLSTDEADEEDFSSFQQEPISKTCLDNISLAVDRLYRLAFKIRNPAMRVGLSKAQGYQEVDPETNIDLIQVYADFDLRHILEVFCQYHQASRSDMTALNDHYLVKRLAKANTRRRQQFRYWKHRKTKYERHSEMANNPESWRQAASSIPPATQLDSSKVKIDEDTSVVSIDSFVVMMDEGVQDKVEMPDPPSLDPESREFECPYCCTMCPSKIARRDAWETHLTRDLRPYICLYDRCSEPDQQYQTLTEWASHQAASHGYQPAALQACPLCPKMEISTGHIASHLRRIAYFSLPPGATGDPDSQPGSQLSNQAQVESVDTPGSISDTTMGTSVPKDIDSPDDRPESGVRQSLPPLPYPAHASLPDTRVLDPRYTLQPGHYFRKGKVFSILWHEDEGERLSAGNQAYEGPQYRGKFGQSIYSSIRRMVVIKELGNCCWCFAISTYGGQGVAKPGVDPSKHTIVYMQRSWAMPGSNEPHMVKEPLEVAPERNDERLDAMSRLNFGKIYTVEHCVKVLPIGIIAPASMARFTNYARAELEG